MAQIIPKGMQNAYKYSSDDAIKEFLRIQNVEKIPELAESVGLMEEYRSLSSPEMYNVFIRKLKTADALRKLLQTADGTPNPNLIVQILDLTNVEYRESMQLLREKLRKVGNENMLLVDEIVRMKSADMTDSLVECEQRLAACELNLQRITSQLEGDEK